MVFKVVFLTAALCAVASAKDSKAFSLFNVVTFANDECVSTSQTTAGDPRTGACYTAEECTEKGGTAAGGCAMGFGTCCLFTIESRQGTATENSTYIRNEDFPSALMGTATNTLAAATYTLNKCSEGKNNFNSKSNTFLSEMRDFPPPLWVLLQTQYKQQCTH